MHIWVVTGAADRFYLAQKTTFCNIEMHFLAQSAQIKVSSNFVAGDG
jgi:hypothetical protein